MLVSHKHKFIFLKTMKTAGSTTEAYFDRFCIPPDVEPGLDHRPETLISQYGVIARKPGHVNKKRYVRRYNRKTSKAERAFFAHMTAKSVINYVGEETFNSYYKFCNMRNPWDLTVSRYYFVKNIKVRKCPEQESFERWMMNTSEINVGRKVFTIDGEPCVDDVILYENLESEIERVCKIVGAEFNREWIQSHKSHFRPKGTEYRKIHTAETKRLVEEAFAYEIEKYGYKY